MYIPVQYPEIKVYLRLIDAKKQLNLMLCSFPVWFSYFLLPPPTPPPPISILYRRFTFFSVHSFPTFRLLIFPKRSFHSGFVQLLILYYSITLQLSTLLLILPVLTEYTLYYQLLPMRNSRGVFREDRKERERIRKRKRRRFQRFIFLSCLATSIRYYVKLQREKASLQESSRDFSIRFFFSLFFSFQSTTSTPPFPPFTYSPMLFVSLFCARGGG